MFWVVNNLTLKPYNFLIVGYQLLIRAYKINTGPNPHTFLIVKYFQIHLALIIKIIAILWKELLKVQNKKDNTLWQASKVKNYVGMMLNPKIKYKKS